MPVGSTVLSFSVGCKLMYGCCLTHALRCSALAPVFPIECRGGWSPSGGLVTAWGWCFTNITMKGRDQGRSERRVLSGGQH